MSLEQKLEQGLTALGLELPQAARRKMLAYLELLQKWNRVHNLTAVREPDDMVTLHLLDSLAVLPHLHGTRILDVGSGAGLPGIPLALARPDLQLTLLDASHKKSAFQRQAKAELGIPNLEVVCSRAEEYRPEQKFDTVLSRAFADLAEFVRLAGHLCAEGGILLALKGVYPYDELAQLGAGVVQVLPLQVPGLDAQRHLVLLDRL